LDDRCSGVILHVPLTCFVSFVSSFDLIDSWLLLQPQCRVRERRSHMGITSCSMRSRQSSTDAYSAVAPLMSCISVHYSLNFLQQSDISPGGSNLMHAIIPQLLFPSPRIEEPLSSQTDNIRRVLISSRLTDSSFNQYCLSMLVKIAAFWLLENIANSSRTEH